MSAGHYREFDVSATAPLQVRVIMIKMTADFDSGTFDFVGKSLPPRPPK